MGLHMNETGKQHKAAWEYDAYNFWVEHSGTPQERAAEIAVQTVKDYLLQDTVIQRVVFNVFKDSDLAIYQEKLA